MEYNSIYDWSKFNFSPKIESNDYGLKFPPGASQLVKELHAFRLCAEYKNFRDTKKPYHHLINIIRMLWPTTIDLFKDTRYGRIYNTYFLDVIRACCTFKHVGFTGPASCAKTFGASVYNLCMFYASPGSTLGMISTTSGSASERRIWADIQKLHREAKFADNEIEPIGEIVSYLKCLVFDYDKSIGESDINNRDMRNAIQVIPIPQDSKGEEALNTVMGSKNKRVIWTIDEMPAMNDGVDRPCSNLEANPFFQSIVLGNAQFKTDPHGMVCEPRDGWSSVSSKKSSRWVSVTGRKVYFLHGESGPNDDPKIHLNEITKNELPFPYLSNKFVRSAVAFEKGRGDVQLGMSTIDYIRFCIGFWAGDDAQSTILSEPAVKKFNADKKPEPWGPGERRTFASLDPAFTSGGDACSLSFAEYGIDIYNNPQVAFETQSIEIRPIADDREEYAILVANDVVEECIKRKVLATDFCLDISNDGGKMLQAIQTVWKKRGQRAYSSTEKSTDDRYDNKVTQYWFSVPNLIGSGVCRGFNLASNYFKDLSQRKYFANKNSVFVETKKEMKKRIRRSPDNGDSFSYLSYMIIESGLVETFEQTLAKSVKTEKNKGPNYKRNKDVKFQSEDEYSNQLDGCEVL